MGSRKSRKKSSSPTSTGTLQSQLEVCIPSHHFRLFLTLQKLYISRLHTSLIASIASETGSFEEAQKILEPLAQAAVSEEEFQKSLTYGSETPTTSISGEEENIKVDTLSEAEAYQFLRVTFPRPTDELLRSTIKSSGGDIRKAVDIILNTEYLSSTEKEDPLNRERSSDDSDEGDSIWAQRGPGDFVRPKAPKAATGPAFPSLITRSPQKSPIALHSQSSAISKWDVLDSQIAFLSQSLSLAPSRVRSAFHTNGSSLPRTLRNLLNDIPDERVDKDIIANLRAAFKHVDEASLRKILLGTKHNLDCAMELARILDHDKCFTTTVRYSSVLSKPQLHAAPAKASAPQIIDDGEGSYDDMNYLKSHYLTKRNEAFAAASQSFRRSKSDALRSGVAAYYSALGREYDSKYRHYSQLAVNRLVAANSSPNSLDLHRVGVKDAIRLVEERVTAWWSRVGVMRDRGEIRAVENFVIIVGKGDRSKGGSKLGPPVVGWLNRNGWGFYEGTGKIEVWGLRKTAKNGLG
jgi:hypothetical protein